MQSKIALTRRSAAVMVATIFGILAGLGGLTHGIGEVLQGNVAPDGLVVNSWTQGPIASNMGGEPAMTIVPNLLATGLLTIVISAAVLVWAAAFVQRRHGGRILIALSVAMLLVGGGFGPPIIGILAGVAGTRINGPSNSRLPRSSMIGSPFLARLWPWLFAVAAISGTFLVVGSLILVFFFDLNNAGLFLNTFYLTVLSLLLTVLTAPAYDSQHAELGILG